MTKSLEEFRTTINKSLSAHTELLIKELKKLDSKDIHPRVQRVDFEIFERGTTLSIRTFLMDNDWNEVFNAKDENYFASSSVLLGDIECFPSSADLDFFYEKYDLEADVLFIDTVVNWFATTFNTLELGTKLPFYIQRHDSYQTFDLLKNEWIEN